MTVHCEESVKREKKTNTMQQSDVYYQLLSQHVLGIIMPIFRRSKTVCYCIWCTALVLLDVVGSGCGALQDATIRCLLSNSASTCFEHHYAHLQENKFRVLLHMVYCAGSAGCGW